MRVCQFRHFRILSFCPLFFAVLLAAAVIIGVAVSKGSSGGKLVVCLYPGHGGEDFGTVDSSDERWEKVDNLEFALLVTQEHFLFYLKINKRNIVI